MEKYTTYCDFISKIDTIIDSNGRKFIISKRGILNIANSIFFSLKESVQLLSKKMDKSSIIVINDEDGSFITAIIHIMPSNYTYWTFNKKDKSLSDKNFYKDSNFEEVISNINNYFFSVYSGHFEKLFKNKALGEFIRSYLKDLKSYFINDYYKKFLMFGDDVNDSLEIQEYIMGSNIKAEVWKDGNINVVIKYTPDDPIYSNHIDYIFNNMIPMLGIVQIDDKYYLDDKALSKNDMLLIISRNMSNVNNLIRSSIGIKESIKYIL